MFEMVYGVVDTALSKWVGLVGRVGEGAVSEMVYGVVDKALSKE